MFRADLHPFTADLLVSRVREALDPPAPGGPAA
jgi:hypothetical protein